MKASKFFVGAIVGSIIAIAGCGGESQLPSTVQRARTLMAARQTFPNKASKSNTYQWVSGYDQTLQYDYPKSTQPIGSISASGSECSTGKRTFWIVTSSDLVEYTYRGSPTGRTLTETTGLAAGCAVSAKHGDVAVAILSAGDVVLYKGGNGSGTAISDGLQETYFVGYDAKGDLFADGIAENAVALVEMPAGKSSFGTVTLPNTVQFPGSVQWDGKYLAVTDQSTSDIYRYTISNDTAKLRGAVQLSGASDCAATWIAQPRVFCADVGDGSATVYKYPAGGASLATLGGSNDVPMGVVQVSK